MTGSRGLRRDERGETLVELLVAMIILGIAAVAILAGVELSVRSSDLGRKQANGGTYVRSLAESVQSAVAAGGYLTCGGNAYLSSSVRANAGLPSSYGAEASSKVWNGTDWVTCTSAGDKGLQRLELKVTSPGSNAQQAVEKLAVVVREPCSGTLPEPC